MKNKSIILHSFARKTKVSYYITFFQTLLRTLFVRPLSCWNCNSNVETVKLNRLQDALFILYPDLLTFDSKENINFEIRCAMRFQVWLYLLPYLHHTLQWNWISEVYLSCLWHLPRQNINHPLTFALFSLHNLHWTFPPFCAKVTCKTYGGRMGQSRGTWRAPSLTDTPPL